jgi:hypothetical protein
VAEFNANVVVDAERIAGYGFVFIDMLTNIDGVSYSEKKQKKTEPPGTRC